MKDKIKFDIMLLIIVLLLAVIGTAAIYSASSFKAKESKGNSQYYLGKQLFRLCLGLILMVLFISIDYHALLRISPLILGVSFILLLYVLVDGITLNGSKRSLMLNGVTFQPSELAKYALLLFLSSYLVDKGKQIKDFNEGLLPTLGIIGVVIFPILLEPDLGTGLIIFIISLILIFIAGASLYHLSALGASAIVVVSILLKIFPYQKFRVVNYLNAIRGISDPPWQVMQSLISFGNGGVFGVGLGNSRQVMHFLPQPFTDFIFSIIGEETGLLGCTLLLLLFLAFMWRGIHIAFHAPDKQGQLLAVGITASIIIYAFFNAGISLNLLPVTGITMPFISYGGSSLIVHFMAIGILLNISMNNKVERKATATTIQGKNKITISRSRIKRKRR